MPSVRSACSIGIRAPLTSDERDVLQHLAQLAMRLLDLQLALAAAAAPVGIWDGIMTRLAFSTQRTDTLWALAQRPGAPAGGPSLYQKQLLLVADIDYGITRAFARLAAP
ncbi:hypothetical protein ACFQ48_21205 [Hymenobacter caeli]|uniref:Uncharacterized protein n=1 Tax=Hymenobacter caeli TaxID=2735894 RepID=A0ABX2FW60_9BACT|nr:hypothetical protein [Hymenobacter caeli]NRT21463.1 hypothetical protein [Hymenobacter caeli]